MTVVWDLFQNIPVVVSCMPGAQLTEDKGGGHYAGRLGIKLGPFGASFEGDAEITADPLLHSGHAVGRALDKKGGSRSKLVLDYKLTEIGSSTRVNIDADVQLSGPIAQFGRTGIIDETAAILIGQFVKNVEERLSPSPEPQAPQIAASVAAAQREAVSVTNELNALNILRLLITSFFRRLVGQRA